MDSSPAYKELNDGFEPLQKMWEPEAGDFWGCNCSSCIKSNRSWVLELPDVLSIMEKEKWDNFYRTVKDAAMTSRDCGFGAYWADHKQNGERGYVWLPRLDQLLEFAQKLLDLSEYDVLKHFLNNDFFLIKKSDVSLEQLTLQWIINEWEKKNGHQG